MEYECEVCHAVVDKVYGLLLHPLDERVSLCRDCLRDWQDAQPERERTEL